MIGATKKILNWLLVTLTTVTVIFLLAGAIVFYTLYVSLPDPTPAVMFAAPLSTQILDRNGILLYEASAQTRRTSIPLHNIPKYLQDATIAIEDKNFYHHRGFDPSAILRAAIANFKNGEIRQGASTLTQQLTRTILLDRDQSYTRKIKELVLAVKIEQRYKKDEILELYLNNIPYGSNVYGVEAASRLYFGKGVTNLSLKESAYLAALPKAPTIYSPYGPNIEELHRRANLVVDKMLELDLITSLQAKQALEEAKPIFNNISTPIKAPHFVFYVLDKLVSQYGEEKVRNSGMKVYTSLDYAKQVLAEKIITARSAINENKFQATNAALVATDPTNGEILAMVGSRNYFKARDGNVNVTLRPRQPGSSFKPYVYATALEKKFTPATIIIDKPTNFAPYNNGVTYIPKNYSGKSYGRLTVRQALAGSLNVPAVKVLVAIGINKAIDTAEKLGLSTLKERERFGPAIVLGGAEVTLLEHTIGLGSFGNRGIYQEPTPILKIQDSNGKLIFEKTKQKGRQAVNPQAAYLINSILSDNQARIFIFGPRNKLFIPDRQIAVKTGTTQDFRDAWTIGYAPDLAVGVWVGNNDNSPMKKGADGSVVAAPIWNDFMTKALSVRPKKEFERPTGIVELKINPRTGELLPQKTLFGKNEFFASYNIPKIIASTSTKQIMTKKTSPSKIATSSPINSISLNKP